MPDLYSLEQRIRRSSSFNYPDIYQDYIQYASQCRDQIQVYLYMEECKIGIQHAQFWLKMLQTLKRRCQFKQIIKKLTKIKKIPIVKQNQSQYAKILEFQSELAYSLQNEIRQRRGKKRRSVSQLEIFSLSKIQKKKRKVGGIQIYVDQSCRDNYLLEDCSQFFQNQLKDQIQTKRAQYQRSRQSYPLSFLGNQKNTLQNNYFQLMGTTKRNSVNLTNNERRSTFMIVNGKSNRFSISRKSNILTSEKQMNNPQKAPYETPKNNRKSNNKNQIASSSIITNQQLLTTPKQKQAGNRWRDSGQFLISYRRNAQKKSRKESIGSNDHSDENSRSQKKENGNDQMFEDDLFNEIFALSRQQIRAENRNSDLEQELQYFEDSINKQNNQKHQSNQCQNHQLNDGCFYGNEENTNLRTKIQHSYQQAIELDYVIKQSQIEALERQTLSLQESQFFENNLPFYQSQSHQQLSISNPLIKQSLKIFSKNGIKSTQTLQSIDSNQENVFTNQKPKQDAQLFNNNNKGFRKDRKLFRVLGQDDLMTSSNVQSTSVAEVWQSNEYDVISLEGGESIKQMIDGIDLCIGNNMQKQNNMQVAYRQLNSQQSHNLVLQTLRKKKLNSILTSQSNQQQFYSYTNSQKRHSLKQLSYISEENSYKSQKKYTNKQRYSSEYAFINEFENQIKQDEI